MAADIVDNPDLLFYRPLHLGVWLAVGAVVPLGAKKTMGLGEKEAKMKRFGVLVTATVLLALSVAGCDGKAKEELAKCQVEAAKTSAELKAAKDELETVKKDLAEIKAKFEATEKERQALQIRVTELEATAASAQEQAAKPAPATAPAKKATKPKEQEPPKTSTGATVPTVSPKQKGRF